MKPTHILNGLYPVIVSPCDESEFLINVTYTGPEVPENRKIGQRCVATPVDFSGRPKIVPIKE